MTCTVIAPVNDIDPAVARILKDENRTLSQIQLHHRVGDGQLADDGLGFGDDNRIVTLQISRFICCRLNNVIGRFSIRRLFLRRPAALVEAPFVTAQTFLQSLERLVKTGIGVMRLAMGFKAQA